MKKIKAQTSTDFLVNMFPLNAIDYSRNVLTSKESATLYDIWKNGSESGGKFIKADCDRLILTSLREKGYIRYDGITIEFTKSGKGVIKKLILGTEQNSFEKKADQ